jgi:hypothetical protein
MIMNGMEIILMKCIRILENSFFTTSFKFDSKKLNGILKNIEIKTKLILNHY